MRQPDIGRQACPFDVAGVAMQSAIPEVLGKPDVEAADELALSKGSGLEMKFAYCARQQLSMVSSVSSSSLCSACGRDAL